MVIIFDFMDGYWSCFADLLVENLGWIDCYEVVTGHCWITGDNEAFVNVSSGDVQ